MLVQAPPRLKHFGAPCPVPQNHNPAYNGVPNLLHVFPFKHSPYLFHFRLVAFVHPCMAIRVIYIIYVNARQEALKHGRSHPFRIAVKRPFNNWSTSLLAYSLYINIGILRVHDRDSLIPRVDR